MKKCFAVLPLSQKVDIGFFLLRLIVGVAFILHGWGKIQSPMGWMGPDSPVPGVFQALAALSEFGGGIALILGFLTRLASLGLLFTMAVAVYTHAIVMGDPFVGREGSYELAAIYFFISLLFVLAGPGSISLDRKVFGVR